MLNAAKFVFHATLCSGKSTGKKHDLFLAMQVKPSVIKIKKNDRRAYYEVMNFFL